MSYVKNDMHEFAFKPNLLVSATYDTEIRDRRLIYDVVSSLVTGNIGRNE